MCDPLKPEKWSPIPFAHLSRLRPSPDRRRAYEAQQSLLTSRDLKLLREWEIFVRFCQVEGMAADPANVVMLDPNSSHPPPPDLQCHLAGESHFFELGEIIQEDIAKASALHTRRSITEARLPLARIWDPLERMLTKKLNKVYNLQARPLSLLLYYASSPSFWRHLQPIVSEIKEEIQMIFEASVFDSMWLFDATKYEILFYLSRSSALAK